MKTTIQAFRLIFGIMGFIALPLAAWALDVGNQGQCDVCPGSIHYNAEESKKILGNDGFDTMLKLNGIKVIKMDLDGVKKQGNAESPDEGYELRCWIRHRDFLYIKSLKDGSLIQVVANFAPPKENGIKDWSPEIYLTPSHKNRNDEISLTDTPEEAWKKMEKAHIYKWIGVSHTDPKWEEALGNKIRSIMKRFLPEIKKKPATPKKK